jgi:hypothetical protein
MVMRSPGLSAAALGRTEPAVAALDLCEVAALTLHVAFVCAVIRDRAGRSDLSPVRSGNAHSHELPLPY